MTVTILSSEIKGILTRPILIETEWDKHGFYTTRVFLHDPKKFGPHHEVTSYSKEDAIKAHKSQFAKHIKQNLSEL